MGDLVGAGDGLSDRAAGGVRGCDSQRHQAAAWGTERDLEVPAALAAHGGPLPALPVVA